MNRQHSGVINVLSPPFVFSALPPLSPLVFVSLSLSLWHRGRIPFNSSTESQTIKAEHFCPRVYRSVCLIHLHAYAQTNTRSLPHTLPHTWKLGYTVHIHPLTRSYVYKHMNKHTKAHSLWCILFGHGFNGAFYGEQDYRITSLPPCQLIGHSLLCHSNTEFSLLLNATVRLAPSVWSRFSYTDLAAGKFCTLGPDVTESCHRASSVSTSSSTDLSDLHLRKRMIWHCYKKFQSFIKCKQQAELKIVIKVGLQIHK